jgi:hypothetical protein
MIALTVSGCAQYDPLLNLNKPAPLPAPLQLSTATDDGAVSNSGNLAMDSTAGDEPRVTVRKTPRPPAAAVAKTTQPQATPANEKADISCV